MKHMAGVVLLILVALAASSCGGSGPNMQPSPSPSPSPSPGPSTAPSISSISPKSAAAGSPDITLSITGASFKNDGRAGTTLVAWSTNPSDPNCCGTWIDTTFVSSTQLTAVLPAALLQNPVTAQIFVETGDPMGIGDGVSYPRSSSLTFTVTAPAAAVSPSSAVLGPKSSQQFVAIMNNQPAEATWTVEEGPTGGTITASGLYTVPNQVGTFHVTATPVNDPSKSATATVTVVSSGFTSTGGMHKARSGHTAVLLKNGKVLILDSEDGSAELFDPATGTFTQTGSMNTPRTGFAATAAALANGKALVVGGYGPGTGTGFLPKLNTAELYDPSTGVFTPTGNMVDARVDPSGTLLDNGKVLIAGGVGSEGPGCAIATAELYDPSTGTFSLAGSMATARVGHTATRLLSGDLLVAGGRNGCAPDSPDDPPWDPLFGELFVPATGTFTESSNMSTTRIGHTATRLSDGKLLLLGGIPAVQNLHEQPPNPAYAEIYDPVTGDFSPVPNLLLLQDSYTATLLANGDVLIAGGEEAGVSRASASLINVVDQTVTPTGSLVTARAGHTATLLNDGRVLVTGGKDISGKALASAELYRALP